MNSRFPIPKDLQVLTTVVDKGSLAAAADELGQTPAFVTKRIQFLENQLGVKLLHRSSHGIALTDIGKLVHQRGGDILEQLQSLLDAVSQAKTEPKGMVRIGCSFGFGRNYIAPAITQLMDHYPELQIHFELFDRQIDLHKDNIDLDIRINDDIADSCIARLLTKNQRILCASPQYIRQRGMPASLAELQQHDCLITKERDQTVGVWELENQQGRKSVKVSGHLSSNSGEIVLRWALEGKGIMLRSLWDIAPLLKDGSLIRVLPAYAQSANIWAVYQTPLYASAKLRACVEHFARYCRQQKF